MGSLSSSTNSVLVNKCQSLQGLTLSMQAIQDLITQGNNGFSLQLNCYPQTNPVATYNGKPMYWAQYVIAVQTNSVQWAVQYWSHVGTTIGEPGFGFSPPGNFSVFASAPSSQLPKGSTLKIALRTESNGKVTQAEFSFTNPKGHLSQFKYVLPSNALMPLYGFQVNLVGPPSGTHHCNFTSAAGFLTYSVSSGTLAVQNVNTCGGPQPPTAETSNAFYGQVLPTSGRIVGQEFGLAVHSPPVPKL
jgi:hypothetical protein